MHKNVKSEQVEQPVRKVRVCPTRTPEVHELGEFPMSCYACHIEADS